MVGRIVNLTSYQANFFLLPRHYSGRKPVISKAFGWVVNDRLQAVITFGKPASPAVCKGICGDKWIDNVYELNRLCREESFDLPLSMFVSAVLRKLKTEDWIIVSYSDTGMHHNGYIYQACNFMFNGQTKERTDPYTGENKHARHYTQDDLDRNIRVLRTAKNRYLYFCTNNKALKREWMNDLRHPILPYPKEENQNYVLGEYIKPILVDKTTGERIVI